MENCVEGGLAQARDLLAETSSAAPPFTWIHNCDSLPPQMGSIMDPWWVRYLLKLPLNIERSHVDFAFVTQ